MIKNSVLLQKLEQEQIKKEKYSYLEALKIFESLYQEAINLGVIQKLHPLEGIEIDIKVARTLLALK